MANKQRSAPLKKWITGKASLQHMKASTMAKQNELHDDWFVKIQENKLKWETEIYKLQCEELKQRMQIDA